MRMRVANIVAGSRRSFWLRQTGKLTGKRISDFRPSHARAWRRSGDPENLTCRSNSPLRDYTRAWQHLVAALSPVNEMPTTRPGAQARPLWVVFGRKGVRELNVTIVPNTIKCMKRGLVLEGGGAKGAYEFGCLLAFRDRGVRFDAIAGTSIGAINGLLWASDKVYEERNTWTNLNDETAFKRQVSGWLRPVMLFWFHHYRNSLRGLMHTVLPAAVIRLPQDLYLLGTILVATMFYIGTSLAYAQVSRSAQELILAIGVAGTLLLLFDVMFLSQKHFEPRLKLAMIGLTTLSSVIHVASSRSGQALRSELWVAAPSWIVLLFYIGY
jgi:hypothetical protein